MPAWAASLLAAEAKSPEVARARPAEVASQPLGGTCDSSIPELSLSNLPQEPKPVATMAAPCPCEPVSTMAAPLSVQSSRHQRTPLRVRPMQHLHANRTLRQAGPSVQPVSLMPPESAPVSGAANLPNLVSLHPDLKARAEPDIPGTEMHRFGSTGSSPTVRPRPAPFADDGCQPTMTQPAAGPSVQPVSLALETASEFGAANLQSLVSVRPDLEERVEPDILGLELHRFGSTDKSPELRPRPAPLADDGCQSTTTQPVPSSPPSPSMQQNASYCNYTLGAQSQALGADLPNSMDMVSQEFWDRILKPGFMSPAGQQRYPLMPPSAGTAAREALDCPGSPSGAAGLLGFAQAKRDAQGSLSSAASRSPPPPRNPFRRALSVSERQELTSLLETSNRSTLEATLAQEFEWACSSGSRLPADGPPRIDYAGAASALRQLTYANGLPSLESDALSWYFDQQIRSSKGTSGQEATTSIDLQEFQAASMQILQAAQAHGAYNAVRSSSGGSTIASLLPSSSLMVPTPCSFQ